ncbi:RND efflux system, outer membrane lipoprotein, NodT family [Denitrovibrio acetiphilus DSM 12809]|uniref:RND efflux system, outer membrane lipoprotein, NodT family n=1 Tax=Denitrovibrio acetiphilus (strain DSM 12809 / NBRC 114555 / N2460) TaxID=522772 RepID=D4H5E1_DENA2|nr:efflux transporter outer membrane subunit [Denitrovibrio acetiphilus]ADD67561.1 RND efflux system, outer membrane lipoprotein, NodT family [Denitrovibrio acetiphilus DSM 12809]
MALRYCRLVLVFFVLAALAGCAGTTHRVSKSKLDEEIKYPDAFSFSGTGAVYDGKWWEVFGISELNILMEQMLENNKEIAGSYEGLKALQAALGISTADRMPSLSLETSAGDTYSTTGGSREWRDSYDISLTASYEVDIWGRIRSAVESDRMALLSGRFDTESLYMTLTAEFADRYFLYKSLASVLKMQEEILTLRQKQVKVLEMTYTSGIGSLDSIYTKQTTIAVLLEDISETKQSMLEAKYQMALLLGEADAGSVKISDSYNLAIPDLPEIIPGNIAEKRPDIRSAYASVLQINSDVAQAMANRYPKLSFSASAGYSGDEISSLITPENFVTKLIANLTAPIFDAGNLKNQQLRQEYLLKQEIQNYYQAVLEGLKEVSDSLADNMQNEQALKLSQKKVGIEENRLRIAEMKYKSGIEDYSTVLDNKISLLSGWITEVNARRSLISSRVELARASGGSWADGLVDERLAGLPDLQETR